jgi:hypothetical protein
MVLLRDEDEFLNVIEDAPIIVQASRMMANLESFLCSKVPILTPRKRPMASLIVKIQA